MCVTSYNASRRLEYIVKITCHVCKYVKITVEFYVEYNKFKSKEK